MKLTITVEQLRYKGACADGVDAFREHFGGDSVEIDWTVEQQLAILRSEMRRWLGWAVARGIVTLWSMRGADLSGADLYGADLSGADLYGAVGAPTGEKSEAATSK